MIFNHETNSAQNLDTLFIKSVLHQVFQSLGFFKDEFCIRFCFLFQVFRFHDADSLITLSCFREFIYLITKFVKYLYTLLYLFKILFRSHSFCYFLRRLKLLDFSFFFGFGFVLVFFCCVGVYQVSISRQTKRCGKCTLCFKVLKLLIA